MNKKGYTLIELVAVIMLLAVLISFALFSYLGYLNKARNKSFNIILNNFTDAVETFYSKCNNELITRSSLCDLKKLNNKNDKITITLSELKSNNLIDKIDNPYGSGDCSGSANVTLIDDIQFTYDIKTCLICGKYKSDNCN